MRDNPWEDRGVERNWVNLVVRSGVFAEVAEGEEIPEVEAELVAGV
jgi:hypothetical protein